MAREGGHSSTPFSFPGRESGGGLTKGEADAGAGRGRPWGILGHPGEVENSGKKAVGECVIDRANT
eukprot:scaffold66739_cov32-Tisochrysis_lutea.AAC.9